ncbi:hypothetical protein QVD17_01754 [Tagetes erecta]|uniref:Uncharacterized protein n=1 Tax=Tagetes erecta TaxID=13708 RepID=A0AAD8L5E5_TARER|nr:hypothetical protein QVD17_01754 [Tagetes erecta]
MNKYFWTNGLHVCLKICDAFMIIYMNKCVAFPFWESWEDHSHPKEVQGGEEECTTMLYSDWLKRFLVGTL